jgi:hypothetical protein
LFYEFDCIPLTHHVPVSNDLSLLLTLVPKTSHDQESRLANGLEDTEECSDSNERREAEAEGVAGKYGTPCEDVETKVFGDWYSLENPIGWVFDDKHSEVDTGGEPPKSLLGKKARNIVTDTHD